MPWLESNPPLQQPQAGRPLPDPRPAIVEDCHGIKWGSEADHVELGCPGRNRRSGLDKANAEVYNLHAWPVVAAGVSASAEITKTSFVVHGNPSERELHYSVKNTGTTAVDIAVWAFWWNA